jgi:hypothetical protein
MTTAKEAIYDEQIFPLMEKIIDICKEHKISMIFDVALGCPEGSDDQLKCTSFLIGPEFDTPDEMRRAAGILLPRRDLLTAITITTPSKD